MRCLLPPASCLLPSHSTTTRQTFHFHAASWAVISGFSACLCLVLSLSVSICVRVVAAIRRRKETAGEGTRQRNTNWPSNWSLALLCLVLRFVIKFWLKLFLSCKSLPQFFPIPPPGPQNSSRNFSQYQIVDLRLGIWKLQLIFMLVMPGTWHLGLPASPLPPSPPLWSIHNNSFKKCV